MDSVHTAARPVVSAASILDEKLSTASALARKLEQEAHLEAHDPCFSCGCDLEE